MCATRQLCLLAVLIAYATACSPAQQANVDRLKKYFGMEPFYPNGKMETNGYNNEYIQVPSDLNCNFNTDESPQPDNNAQKAALCKWKNMQGERSDLDSEDFYLFTKTDDKKWSSILRPVRDRARQTPAKGDGFALTGGEGRPAPKSIYYSSPIACSENPTQLSFDYWLYSSAELHVLVLEEKTFKTLWEAPPNACGKTAPKDGRCKVEIPPQAAPYHLAINGRELNKQFAIIDNIDYSGTLGKKCEGGGDPFDFGTTGSALASRANAGSIVAAKDLVCNGGTDCRWANAPNSEVLFERHTAPVDAEKWAAASGDTTMPSGDFFMAHGDKDGKAVLMSDRIDCQWNDGVLTFRAWASEGTTLQVCAVDADTLVEFYTCEQVYPPMKNGEPFTVPVFGPLSNARLLFRGSDWNAGNGGFVAIDDINYSAGMCSEQPPSTIAPTTPPPIDENVCEQISTDFNQAQVSASSWKDYPQSTYQGRPVVKHSINKQFETAQNTRVECPDGGLCAGSLLDKTANVPISILQTEKFNTPLTVDRYLQVRTRRGTYATIMYLCSNSLPNIDVNGTVTGGGQCTPIAGPDLTYEEYRNGKVTGAMLPKGTNVVYFLFTNPVKSGADKAAFLVDNIQLLKGDEQTGPLCKNGNDR